MKLVYFNGRGLAETSRLLLAAAGAEYEDFRYPLEVLDWATHDFKKEAFDADKAAGKFRPSLGKVPYLEVDSTTIIPQSKAIERYIASKFDMNGKTAVETAHIDAICEYVRDFKQEYQKTRGLKGEEREAGMATWFGETLPERLVALEARVGDNGFAVGESTSLADITIYGFVTQFFDNVDGARKAAETAPLIHKIVERVGDMPSIQGWLESRPETPF